MGCNCVIGKLEEEIDDQRVQQISKLIKKSLYKNSESNQEQSKINKKHNKIPKYIKRLFNQEKCFPIYNPRKKHLNAQCILNSICHSGKF